MTLWHVREAPPLAVGDTIAPGRWGEIIEAMGPSHQFYEREQRLEAWRVGATDIAVSRLSCVFAFDDRATAVGFLERSEYLYVVEPAGASPSARLDMLWLTWMGEPGHSEASIDRWVSAYWAGASTAEVSPTAHPSWEVLIGGPVTVVAAEEL